MAEEGEERRSRGVERAEKEEESDSGRKDAVHPAGERRQSRFEADARGFAYQEIRISTINCPDG